MNMGDTVTISRQEYERLLNIQSIHASINNIGKEGYDYLCHRDEWLSYLESAGVDNWQGYDFAIELAREGGHFDDDEEE